MLAALIFFLTLAGQAGTAPLIAKSPTAFDVKDLRLVLEVFPDTKTIAGYARMNLALVGAAEGPIELHLVDSLQVSRATINGVERPFKHAGTLLSIGLPKSATSPLELTIYYAGSPQVARRPPWSGGFNWSQTAAGQPWIGVSCQTESGMVWFPCKGLPTDKIEGARLEITAPEPLYCAANGLLEKIEQGQGKRTFFWHTKYPISNYNLSINLADYEVSEQTFDSFGRHFPVVFYMLKEEQPGNRASGDQRDFATKKRDLMALTMEYLDFYSRFYGEYPWADEKFGLVQTAYLGMEHQTINSYGSRFQLNLGYDYILLHEMGHEWWGNQLTMRDWSDFWLHEGICTYATGVYLEEEYELDFALNYFDHLSLMLFNRTPLAADKGADAHNVFDNDVYNKGALMLHSLRFLIGKEKMDGLLKAFATDPALTGVHTARSSDFTAMAEKAAGRDLDWFFDAYLHRAALPQLTIARNAGVLRLHWDPPNFAMPLEVAVGGETQLVTFAGGNAELMVGQETEVSVDPRHWVLKKIVDQSRDADAITAPVAPTETNPDRRQ